MNNSRQNRRDHSGERNSNGSNRENNRSYRNRNTRGNTVYDDYYSNYESYNDNDDDYQRQSGWERQESQSATNKKRRYVGYAEEHLEKDFYRGRSGSVRNSANYGSGFFENREDNRRTNNYGASNNFGYGNNDGDNYRNGEYVDDQNTGRNNSSDQRGSWGGRLDSDYDGEFYDPEFDDERYEDYGRDRRKKNDNNSERNPTYRYQNENAGNISDRELSGRTSRRVSYRTRKKR